jgi:hypothetical protein
MYGNKWSDFNNQLEYVHWELNNTKSKAGQALKNAKDFHSAGEVFSDLYEVPKVKYKQDKTRRQFVTDVYKSLVNSDYEYVAPQQEQSTFDPTKYESIIKPLNYLPETNINTTFAGVPDGALPQEEKTEKEEQQTDKDIAELQNKTAEQNFLEELYQSNSNRETTDQSQMQPQPQQKAPPVDYMQMYEQVSNFVDTPLIGGEEVMQQGGEYSESELAFLSEIAIKDNQGQYNHPNKITEINSPNITMKGLTKPLLGISKETGETKYMLPNKDYKFGKNTKNVIEIPLFKK